MIFVTAVSEVMDAARGFAAGAVDYITKPFHPPMVKARVALHLELKRKYALYTAKDNGRHCIEGSELGPAGQT